MIFVGAHHKTGSLLFQKIFADVAKELNVLFYRKDQRGLPSGTAIWFNDHSLIDPKKIPVVRGLHIIRHPLEVIASAYRYHLICREKWCVSRVRVPAVGVIYDFDGMTYQEKLRSLPKQEGLRFEMQGRSYHAIMAMYRWNRQDTRFLNLRYEDVMADFDGTLRTAFAFVGLDPDRCLPIAAKHDLKRMAADDVTKLAHVTNKAGGDTWPDYFNDPTLMRAFEETFPRDVLSRLEYHANIPAPASS